MKYFLFFFSTFFVMPFMVFAQVQNIFDVGGLFLSLFSMLVVLIVALALVLFMWGVVKYIHAQGDAEGRKEARKYIVFGIVSLFVMLSVWGLVNILVQTFGTSETQIPVETTCEGPGC